MIIDRLQYRIFLIVMLLLLLLPRTMVAEETAGVQFSHPGGFYEHKFSLVLKSSVPNGEIRYTLDGSEPTKDSLLYTAPIPIGYQPDNSGGIEYIETTMERIPDFMEWQEPGEDIFKATVVRAQYFSTAGPVGVVETQTYFVDGQIRNRFTMPVIAIAADPAGLFSFESGIYVPGIIYDQNNTDRLAYGQQPANYNERGDEWERTANMAWYEPDGYLGFSQDVGIRIHGAWSRIQTMKSLRVYARSKYGEGNIDYPVLGEEQNRTYECLIMRNAGQDFYRAYLRDIVGHSILQHLDLDIQRGRPVVVFINGVYWGIHHIRERFDETYFEHYHGVDPEDLVLMENNSLLMVGNDTDTKLWNDVLDYLTHHDITQQDHYDHLLNQIDLDSFLDQTLVGLYTANQDWPGNNVRFWRVRDPDESEAAAEEMDGRWRWLINDLDVGFHFPEYNMYDRLVVESRTYPAPAWSTLLFRSLLQQDGFRSRFLSRLDYHLNSTFSSEHVIQWVDYWQDQLVSEMPHHIDRWQVPASIQEWEKNVNVVRTFAEERPAYLRAQTEEVFGLNKSLCLTVRWIGERGGDVWVHGIPAPSEDSVWQTEFFHGTSIKLEAVPRTGFQFVGWKTSDGEFLDDVEIQLEEDMEIIPVFQRLLWAQIPVLWMGGLAGSLGLYFSLRSLMRRKKDRAHELLLTAEETVHSEMGIEEDAAGNLCSQNDEHESEQIG